MSEPDLVSEMIVALRCMKEPTLKATLSDLDEGGVYGIIKLNNVIGRICEMYPRASSRELVQAFLIAERMLAARPAIEVDP